MTTPAPPVSPAAPPLAILIDTDPGIDDMLALLLALASPELDVRGITVSYGNTLVENAYRNAVEILRRAGKRVTLGMSARRPLKRPLAVARETHGDSGLGYAALPPAGVTLDFVRPLERLLAEQPHPVTLVTLGPLTGLALALHSDAALVRAKVARHIAMAGNLAAQGNTTRYSEFNAWCDPEALDVVLRAELPTELVGLDVTRQAVLAPAEIARLANSGTPQARWIAEALRFYVEFHKQYEGLDGCIVNDILPIAGLVSPRALTFEEQRLVVDLEDGEHRGHTRADPQGARVRVATRVDMALVRPLLSERVFRWAARPAAVARAAPEARA
ncbi:MAG TPA: nucleoside hydrolase [Gemmatimonadales bacterium]|nr:nucleoside hydrolase [Gemmatimonadales bacterium]